MVFLLPLYHPLRLVEEICMLDHLSRGRLELGVGRGASPFELAQFGVEAAESRAMFQEALQLLVDGLRTGRMSNPDGRYHPLVRADLILRPYQQPYPPLWYPTESYESVPWIAQQGISLLTRRLPPGKTAGDFAAAYRRELEAHREEPGRLNGHVAEPLVGVVRHVLVAETDAEALTTAREAWKHFTDSHGYLGRLHGRPAAAQVDFDAQLGERMVLVGSPATVREGVRAVVSEARCTYFACCFAWGNLSTERVLGSIDLFTRHVRPAIEGTFGGAVAAGG
jgi:alkanesulfonate monooxygenase SsuD/methylene tetrahydromethanopterin reductase-like flavin-dependent oxidoreductase (luciferase family)